MACTSAGASHASPSGVICSVSSTTDLLPLPSATIYTEWPLERSGFTPPGVFITFTAGTWAIV